MDSVINDMMMSALRLAHSFAALVWLGGGVYFLVAIRPAQRALAEAQVQVDGGADTTGTAASGTAGVGRSLISAMQGAYAEWAQAATLIMLASGVILIFERLSVLTDHFYYAVALGVKVLAAVIALWMTTMSGRRRRRQSSARAQRAGTDTTATAIPWQRRYRTEIIVALGAASYALGVVLSGVSADI